MFYHLNREKEPNMKQKKWDKKIKTKVVLDGLKGKSIATICNEYQISQSLYYQWRDQFLYPKKLEISLYSRLQTKELRLSSAVIHPIGFAVK